MESIHDDDWDDDAVNTDKLKSIYDSMEHNRTVYKC
jgi:hypothetical protein